MIERRYIDGRLADRVGEQKGEKRGKNRPRIFEICNAE